MSPVLVVNSGSSSFKYQLIDIDTETTLASGLVERIGEPTGRATHTVVGGGDDIVKTLKKLTGGGADYAFECVGHGAIVAQAYGCLRKGGKAVAVGVAKQADTTTIRTNTLAFEEKVLTGSCFGGARPREDFPRLINLYRAGRLKLDELITHRYTIDEAPQAFDDLANGRNARGMIVFG